MSTPDAHTITRGATSVELRVGIDVGGTFTDVFLYNSEDRRYWLAKTPSTPQNQAEGVVTGLVEVCRRAGLQPGDVTAILHGTTVATNALLEGKGARVGLLVTSGWRNILHLADSWTPGPLFGFFSYVPTEPVVPYERIQEVPERVAPDGEVVAELDEELAAAAVEALLDEDVEAITVALLNSYCRPAHERRVASIARAAISRRGLSLPVSLSSEVSPEFREYERTMTTVVNSFLGPVMRNYLSRLESALAEVPVGASLQVVRSDGGLMSVGAASEYPVHTALSGPAGGVSGAAAVGQRAGAERIVTLDMGGTSTDVAVCLRGAPEVTRETRVASFPVRAPAVGVTTIGAGGGSVAEVSDLTGGLRVGPRSAGASPGPACYGRGGTEPTVTDADLVLGHLPPALLGGAMVLDAAAARDAVATVGAALGCDVHRAAQAIIDIVNGNMLGALRVATVQRGLPPDQFAMVCFGGAGGLHANALAAALGSYPVIVPPEPGVLSALGFVFADVRNEFARPFLCALEELDVAALQSELAAAAADARRWLTDERVPRGAQEVRYVIEMRYRRQGYELGLEVDELTGGDLDASTLGDLFRAHHEQVYGFSLPAPADIVTLRARAIGRSDPLQVAARPLGGTDPSSALVGEIQSWNGEAMSAIPLYERSRLTPGMVLEGKAVIQQYDSTTLVLPGHVASVDPWLNVLIEVAK